MSNASTSDCRVIWTRPTIPQDLILLSRYEQELEEAFAEAVRAYERVDTLRELVASLRTLT